MFETLEQRALLAADFAIEVIEMGFLQAVTMLAVLGASFGLCGEITPLPRYSFTNVLSPDPANPNIGSADINRHGDMVYQYFDPFNASLREGGLYVYQDGESKQIISRSEFLLPNHPQISDTGRILFTGLSDSTDEFISHFFSGIWISDDGGESIEQLVGFGDFIRFTSGSQESGPQRPVLNDNGEIAFFGEAIVGNQLQHGIYNGPDPVDDALAVGGFSMVDTDPMAFDFNDQGDLAIMTNTQGFATTTLLGGAPDDLQEVALGGCNNRMLSDCFYDRLEAAGRPADFELVGGEPVLLGNGDVLFNVNQIHWDSETDEFSETGFGAWIDTDLEFGDTSFRTLIGGSDKLTPVYQTNLADGRAGIFVGAALDKVDEYGQRGRPLSTIHIDGDELFGEPAIVRLESVSSDGKLALTYRYDGNFIEGLAIAIPLPSGDTNEDGLLSVADLDLLSAEILSGADRLELFDLNGDLSIDQLDRDVWISDVGAYRVGDADLNGQVEFVDFLQLANNFGKPGRWSTGDFDGSGTTDFLDFLLLADNFNEGTNSVASVPEPRFFGVYFLTLLLVQRRARCNGPSASHLEATFD